MFDATPDPTAEECSSVDPTIEVCERHLRMLAEVGEVAMEVTRALGASAVAAAKAVEEILADELWQPETGRARALAGSKDAAEAFHKAARALRLTFALEKATAETLRDLRAGVMASRKATPPSGRAANPGSEATAAATPLVAARDKVRDAATDAIAAAGDITPARELSDDLNERLTESDRFGPLLQRPRREVVEQVCADIGAAPDWIGQFDEDPKPPAKRPPPEWTITGPPNSAEVMCVRRETPQPPIAQSSVPRRE